MKPFLLSYHTGPAQEPVPSLIASVDTYRLLSALPTALSPLGCKAPALSLCLYGRCAIPCPKLMSVPQQDLRYPTATQKVPHTGTMTSIYFPKSLMSIQPQSWRCHSFLPQTAKWELLLSAATQPQHSILSSLQPHSMHALTWLCAQVLLCQAGSHTTPTYPLSYRCSLIPTSQLSAQLPFSSLQKLAPFVGVYLAQPYCTSC